METKLPDSPGQWWYENCLGVKKVADVFPTLKHAYAQGDEDPVPVDWKNYFVRWICKAEEPKS